MTQYAVPQRRTCWLSQKCDEHTYSQCLENKNLKAGREEVGVRDANLDGVIDKPESPHSLWEGGYDRVQNRHSYWYLVRWEVEYWMTWYLCARRQILGALCAPT